MIIVQKTERYRRLYAGDGNGMHAWHAYVEIRRMLGIELRDARAVIRAGIEEGVLLPKWILDYFDGVAAKLIAPGGTSSPKKIAAAAELLTTGGGASARTRATRATRDRAIKLEVGIKQGARLSRDKALAQVADETGLTAERVERILYESPEAKRRRRRNRPKGRQLTK